MKEIGLADRFHGTCNLVILHLRRAAKSNDLEEGFAAARRMGMLKPEHEQFVRDCLELDASVQGGTADADSITEQAVRELQACVLRLNTADPA
ncbi:MAG TPA: hypothetical protein DCP91_04170 [Eggerthellaceae bacterium]|nr:hypothetical protein [Eggerthellaceae bacterium]